jgi:hypothetical protein
MIVAISIDREFDNYTEFYTSLIDIASTAGFKEFCGLDSPILSRFITEAKKPTQTFSIDWGVSKSTPQEFVKLNKNNKPYNSQAPFDAAKKVVAYATHVVEFGKGDFNINKLAKNNLHVVRADAKVSAAAKRYKF